MMLKMICVCAELKTTLHHSVYLSQIELLNLISLIEIIPYAKKNNLLLSHAMSGFDVQVSFVLGKRS